MTLPFALLAGLVLGGALAAVTLRSRVHAGLSLALSLSGLALVFLRLNAEFVGFVQILVYVGAVAVLIVFAILLTRGSESPRDRLFNAPVSGILITVAVFGILAWAITTHGAHTVPNPPASPVPPPMVTVRGLGDRLLRDYVLPLQTLGLLLTAALIGAAVIALPTPASRGVPPGSDRPDSGSSS